METFDGTINADSTTEQIKAAEQKLEAAFKAGFAPNAFGVKLPIGKWKGKATGSKPFLTWYKTEQKKGTILSAIANFDVLINGVKTTVEERVNYSNYADWQKVAINSTIEVQVNYKSATDKTLVLKILSTTLSGEIPMRKEGSEIPTTLQGWIDLYQTTKGENWNGTRNSKTIAKALNMEIA